MNIGEIAAPGGRVAQHGLLRAQRQADRVGGDPPAHRGRSSPSSGYRPNAAARALKEGRTRTLGLVIPPASQRLTDMQLGFVASVVEAAARADLDVLLSPSGGDHDRSFERVVTGRRVDGVILMEIRLEDARVARLQQTGLPFVDHRPHRAPRGHVLGRRGLRRRSSAAACTTWPTSATGTSRWSTAPPSWSPPDTAPATARWPASPRRSPSAASDRRATSAAPTTPRPGRPASEQLLRRASRGHRHRHHQRGRPARHAARARRRRA